jgi:hypothetical protein
MVLVAPLVSPVMDWVWVVPPVVAKVLGSEAYATFVVPYLHVALALVVVVRVVLVVPAASTWLLVGVVMFAVRAGAMEKVLP